MKFKNKTYCKKFSIEHFTKVFREMKIMKILMFQNNSHKLFSLFDFEKYQTDKVDVKTIAERITKDYDNLTDFEKKIYSNLNKHII